MEKLFTNNNYLLLALLLLSIILLFYKKANLKHNHRKNINKSHEILNKLNSIAGQYAEAKKINYLKKINPYVFEELILSTFENLGHKIDRNTKYTGDGGIDGIVWIDNHQYLIQCKRYKKNVNSIDIVKFNNIITNKKAKGGFFVHTGMTPDITYKTYKNSQIEILSGSRLINFINQYK